ncbi:2-oxoacid:acceptor oxidoreductase family protein, partial [uncultured Helicobacter sp.]
NAPMLGAFIKISNLLEIEYFKKAFTKVLGKKLPQSIIDANMQAIQRAYDEVK